MYRRFFVLPFFSFFALWFLSSFVSFSYAGALVYSTYLGGGSDDEGFGIAVDSSGNAYITGYTHSADFPTTSGAFDTSYNGSYDVFVTKLNSSGTALVYSTYLGGRGLDWGFDIAVDKSGNAYITGFTYSATSSTEFPTTPGAFDTSYNGSYDVFVSKLNASGTALIYSTYLGGGGHDEGNGIAVDSSGNAYITGLTGSTNFPTTSGAFDTSLNGTSNAFVTKLNSSGTALVYSTYLGGGGQDWGTKIALDSSRNAYITGVTSSTNFPTTPGAFDTLSNGTNDVFVTKLNSSGTALVYSTYLGGGGQDLSYGIALDSSNNAYVTGYTESTNFPTTPGAFDTLSNVTSNAFVTKLNSSGTALVYSTYLGGGGQDWGAGIALDSSGNAYITGVTSSTNFPTTFGAFDTLFNGNEDVFVSKLNSSGTALVYSTYLGGGATDRSRGIALDSSGNVYITGFTQSTDFPTTPDTFDTLLNGASDVFVTKLSLVPNIPAAVTNIPDVKLLKGKSQSDVMQLDNYLQNTTTASWSWSSQSTFAYLSIDSSSWVDYQTPWSPIAGQDTVVFTANSIGSDTSLLKYSSYLFSRFPQAVVDNGRKILNCDINLQSYLSKDTGIGYPSSYTYETRYSNSADTGKLTISFSGSTIRINPTSALTGTAKVIVNASPGVAYDWDKEIIPISEVVDTYGEFSSASDTSHYWYQLPVIGASSLPTISWVSSAGGHSGVLQLAFSTATQGVKLVYNQELDIEPGAWYTLRCGFASGAGAGNQHLVSGQLFLVDTGTNTAEVGSFLRQSGQLRDTTWWTQYAYVYNTGSTVKKMRPMLVVKNNGSSGNVYVDSMLLYQSEPLVEQAYGALSQAAIPNGKFASGLSGWFYLYPAMGIDTSAPLPGYSVVSSFSNQENVLQLSFTQVMQGLKLTSDPVVNILPMKSTRLSWKVYGVADNPNRSVSGRIYCIDTSSGGVLSDVLGPSGVNASMPSGQWVSYTAEGSPEVNSETQARVQIVIKNGNTTSDTVYLDDIKLEQENDFVPYYWDHSLF